MTSPERNNNFNLLRLIFATLVILSHSPELIDGNRHREILTRLFGTVSFGELAVDGFFVLSGYLIVQSWQRNPQFLNFIAKRVLRIYPGFIVASLISAFVVGPLGTIHPHYFSSFAYVHFFKRLFFLSVPDTPSVFEGQHDAIVNGAMWTIQFEFLCYLLVAAAGVLGIIRQPRGWILICVFLLLLSIDPTALRRLPWIYGHFWHQDLGAFSHLSSFFGVGGCFYVLRNNIRYTKRLAGLSAIFLLICMLHQAVVQIALLTVGAYLLFWFAFIPSPLLGKFRSFPDISYGVYLYGWPTQELLIWYIPTISPWVMFPLALGICSVCGLLSWHLVENPFLKLKPKPERKDSDLPQGTASDRPSFTTTV